MRKILNSTFLRSYKYLVAGWVRSYFKRWLRVVNTLLLSYRQLLPNRSSSGYRGRNWTLLKRQLKMRQKKTFQTLNRVLYHLFSRWKKLRFMESECEVIRCGNMYLVPGQVTEAPAWATFLPPMSPGDQGQGWHLASQCQCQPRPGSSLSGSPRSDSVYSNSAFHCSPSTDCILASRRDIHHTVTRSDEGKLEKILASLCDNGHVFSPVFKYHCWVIWHVTIGKSAPDITH